VVSDEPDAATPMDVPAAATTSTATPIQTFLLRDSSRRAIDLLSGPAAPAPGSSPGACGGMAPTAGQPSPADPDVAPNVSGLVGS
jgi:hypothetical protein